MKKLFLLLLLFTNICLGQVTFTNLSNTYSQNFDLIGASATATLPTGFVFNSSQNYTTGVSNTTFSAGTTGTIISGGNYNFGNGENLTSTDRSIGVLTSGSFTSTITNPRCIILAIQNIGSNNIKTLNISFDYEKYRSGIRQFNCTFSHGSNPLSINIPENIGGQNYTVDTNNTTVYNPPTSINKNFTINVYIPPSGTYYLCWVIRGVGGSTNGQAIGIDNLNIVANYDNCNGYSAWDIISPATTPSWSQTPTINTAVIINADYTSTSFDACSVIVNTGKTLTINSNQYVNIQNELINNGNVIVEDGGSILQVNDNAINTGNITYKRNTTPVTRFDYTYWSTPVNPQTLLNLSPNTLSDKYYEYDTSINNWINVIPSSNMSVGKGYIIRSPQSFDIITPSIYNATFSGVPNNGVYNIPIGSLFNLIGNPYPSAISADMIISNYPGTLYFWTHNTPITNNNYTENDYATYTLVGGVGTAATNPGINSNIPNGKIASGQGFFFKNLSSSTNINFNNLFRLTNNNNQFFRTSFNEKDRFWLEMTNDNGAYKQTLVGYIDGTTNNIDNGYDGEILEAGNIISLYTIVDDKLLTIQGRQYPFNINDLVNLGYKTNINGTFKITLSDVDGLFTTQNIYLQDLYSNTIHDIRQSPYTFNSVSGTFNDRFILRYTNNSLGNNDFVINNTIIYNKDNKINVDSNKIIKNVKVYDITGKLLYDNNFNLNNVKINLECSKQILFVKIKTEDEQVITRKILNE